MKTKNISNQIQIGTDVAAIFVYHPDDLKHHADSRIRWECYEFAGAPEFEKGSLIAWDTGSDGSYTVRLTDSGLTDREKMVQCGSWDFRLDVKHGALLIEGGEFFPNEDCYEEAVEEYFLEIPNGKYKVTVTAIAWHEEPGADDLDYENQLPSYVMNFEAVPDFMVVTKTISPPKLISLTSEPAKPGVPYAPWSAQDSIPELDANADYPVIVLDPKVHQLRWHGSKIYYIDKKLYEFITKQDAFAYYLVLPDKAATEGVIARCVSSGANPKKKEYDAILSVHCRAKVNSIKTKGTSQIAKVEPLIPPRESVTTEVAEQLKSALIACLSTNNEIRESLKCLDFELARVKAINDGDALVSYCLHQLNVPDELTETLTRLGNAQRAERLIEYFNRSA